MFFELTTNWQKFIILLNILLNYYYQLKLLSLIYMEVHI